MDKKSNNISVLKIGIKLLVFIIISCLCLYFIMKADKRTTNTLFHLYMNLRINSPSYRKKKGIAVLLKLP